MDLGFKYTACLCLLAGCSYVVPYAGPPGPPELSDIERRTFDLEGNIRLETMMGVTNKNPEPLTAVLDCEPDQHRSKGKGHNHMGTRRTVTVPPRSTMYVLLDKHDKDCSLLPVE